MPSPQPKGKTMERISDRIKRARLSAGMTQQVAADIAGVHVTRWSHWERGISPRAETLVTVAAVLGVSTDYLLTPSRADE